MLSIFAKQNNLIVLQDAAYATLVFNRKPLSFLSIPGAMDVGVEFHSMSKAFNMTGWRMAYLCGNKDNYKSISHISKIIVIVDSFEQYKKLV